MTSRESNNRKWRTSHNKKIQVSSKDGFKSNVLNCTVDIVVQTYECTWKINFLSHNNVIISGTFMKEFLISSDWTKIVYFCVKRTRYGN